MGKRGRYAECPKGCGRQVAPSSSHPRAGEIATPLICFACGEFVQGTPEEIEEAEAAECAYDRKLEREQRDARLVERDLKRGIVAAPPPSARPKVARRGKQLGLWGKGS